MEVKPVVVVVTQKLADTLNEEPVADDKVMILQLKGVKRSLTKLESFSDPKDLRVHYQIMKVLNMEDEMLGLRGYLLDLGRSISSLKLVSKEVPRIVTCLDSTNHLKAEATI